MNLVSGGQMMTIHMAHAHHMHLCSACILGCSPMQWCRCSACILGCSPCIGVGVVHAYWGVVHALVSV